jgi:hypothetical protein
MRIGLAFRTFFKALFDTHFAQKVEALLAGREKPTPAHPSALATVRDTVVETSPKRSDALTLLATLQREARFVDMVKEPLGEYSDAQVGAAARDVLRDCGIVLDRLFNVQPLVEQKEGSEVEVPVDYEAGRYRLTGDVAGEPPFRGRLMHHGWIATRCEVPSWIGTEATRMIVAPEEVELGRP